MYLEARRRSSSAKEKPHNRYFKWKTRNNAKSYLIWSFLLASEPAVQFTFPNWQNQWEIPKIRDPHPDKGQNKGEFSSVSKRNPPIKTCDQGKTCFIK